jgi:hypothetical protein
MYGPQLGAGPMVQNYDHRAISIMRLILFGTFQLTGQLENVQRGNDQAGNKFIAPNIISSSELIYDFFDVRLK